MERVDRRLLRTSRPARVHLVATVALGCVSAALVVAQAALIARVVTRVFIDGDGAGDVRGAIVALACVAVARGLVVAGTEASGRLGALRAMSELRGRLTAHVLRARPAGLRRERAGEVVAAAVQGVDALEAWFARWLPQVALSVLVPVAILAFVVPRDLAAAGVLAATIPVVPVFMVLLGLAARGRARRRFGALTRLSGHLLDVLRGLPALRANAREGAQERTLADVGEAYRRETMGTLRVAFLSSLVLELAAALATALVAATVGIQLAEGHLGLEAGLTVLLLAPELYLPLRRLGAEWHSSADGLAAAEALFAALDEPPAVSAPARPLPAPDPGIAAVTFESVEFGWPGRGGHAVDRVDLVLEPGRTLALVGPSGAGKSTVAALLLRLVEPGSGRVCCGGTDLRDVDAAQWRSRVAWVPQSPTIFAGTLLDNVRLAAPEASAAAARRALAGVGLSPLADELPDGLETRVGEGGRALSAGEAQRVGLARALLADRPLIVLDEPTAHLDGASAARADEAIARAVAGRTALLIAHRRALAARADRVVTMAAGRVSALPEGAAA
jgi:ATP-binding cassette subfamily C protein CydCD